MVLGIEHVVQMKEDVRRIIKIHNTTDYTVIPLYILCDIN